MATLKVALQHDFNVVIILSTVIYLIKKFKLKIDLKSCILKNLKNSQNLYAFFKNQWQP